MKKYFDINKIEKHYPGAYMIPPMLAWKLPKNKIHMSKEILNDDNYFAEVKIDGGCYTFEHTMQGETYLFSRTVSRTTDLLVEKSDRVPHIVEHLKSILPKGTVVALEIYKPGGKYKDVTTIMGCLAAKAVARQEKNGYLKALVHDLLVYNNESFMEVPAFDRVIKLHNLLENHDPTIIAPVEIRIENKEQYLTECLEKGYEGIILKKSNSEYHPKKRPAWSWIKFKLEDEFDVICLDFYPPTKEYKGIELSKWPYWKNNIPITKPYAKGWIGSIKMGCWHNGQLREIGSVASGLTDKVLEEIKNNPDAFRGKPMLVKAMETTNDFKLREPKFITFRDDINSIDCTFEKIFL